MYSIPARDRNTNKKGTQVHVLLNSLLYLATVGLFKISCTASSNRKSKSTTQPVLPVVSTTASNTRKFCLKAAAPAAPQEAHPTELATLLDVAYNQLARTSFRCSYSHSNHGSRPHPLLYSLTALEFHPQMRIIKCFFAVYGGCIRSAFIFKHKKSKGNLWTWKAGILKGRHCRVPEEKTKKRLIAYHRVKKSKRRRRRRRWEIDEKGCSPDRTMKRLW